MIYKKVQLILPILLILSLFPLISNDNSQNLSSITSNQLLNMDSFFIKDFWPSQTYDYPSYSTQLRSDLLSKENILGVNTELNRFDTSALSYPVINWDFSPESTAFLIDLPTVVKKRTIKKKAKHIIHIPVILTKS